MLREICVIVAASILTGFITSTQTVAEVKTELSWIKQTLLRQDNQISYLLERR